MKFAEFNRKSNSLGVLFFLPFPLAPHPPKWITGQLLREGQYSPAGPSRYGNAESFPRVFSATILTMETTPFYYPEPSVERHLVPLEQIYGSFVTKAF